MVEALRREAQGFAHAPRRPSRAGAAHADPSPSSEEFGGARDVGEEPLREVGEGTDVVRHRLVGGRAAAERRIRPVASGRRAASAMAGRRARSSSSRIWRETLSPGAPGVTMA